jgi:ribosomal protein S18 acetylase RimI-like enzyme
VKGCRVARGDAGRNPTNFFNHTSPIHRRRETIHVAAQRQLGDNRHMKNIVELSRRCELAAYAAAMPNRATMRFGPFVALIDPHESLIWLNYAIPVAPLDAETPQALTALAEHFAAHQRTLRFEFHAAPWPDLPPLLEAAGLQLDERQPVLVCTVATLHQPTDPTLMIRFLTADATPTELAAVVTIQQMGFGGGAGEVTEERLRWMRNAIRADHERYALALMNGVPVGAGSLLPAGPIAEIVGVATHPSFRRRGVAAILSAALARAHFAGGGEVCWLSAGDDLARRVYQRVGFQVIDERLNFSISGTYG